MLATKEKGRPVGSPIPKPVLADSTEYTNNIIQFQAAMLARRFGFLPETANTIATLAFVSGVRT